MSDERCEHCSKTKAVMVQMEGNPAWWLCGRCWSDGLHTGTRAADLIAQLKENASEPPRGRRTTGPHPNAPRPTNRGR